jgi:hypothetical protein
MKHPPQEPDRVPAGLITAVIGIVIVAIGIGVALMHWIEDYETAEVNGDPKAPAEQIGAIPNQVNTSETPPFTVEAQGLDDNARADAWLGSYGWVDRQRGIVHVPLDAAYELYLGRQQALPARQGKR